MVEYEIDKILGSRFLAWLGPMASVEDCAEFINYRRDEHRGANHHCWAWVGKNDAQVRSSDDGEPRGSAGRRILDVLAGHELREVGLVVTRYFGGTKLGVGGLGRAYAQAAREVVARARLVPWVARRVVTLELAYESVAAFDRLVAGWKLDASTIDRDYAAIVTIRVALDESALDEQRRQLEAIGARVIDVD